MDKNKILSSLALAGILTASSLGANVQATSTQYLKPVGVYKNLTQDGTIIIPYLINKPSEGVTIRDLKNEFRTGLTSIGGDTNINMLDENKTLGTGTQFIAGGVNYTLVVYGDVNSDGIVTPDDAREILRAYVGDIQLDEAKKIAAGEIQGKTIMPEDARNLLKFYVTENYEGTKLTEQEDTEAPVITLSGEGVNIQENKYVKYVNPNEEVNLTEVIATATDNYEGNISYKINVDTSNINTSTICEVTYTVYDIAGNKGEAILKLVPVSAKPEIRVEGEEIVYVKQGDNLAEKMPKITAYDQVEGDISNKITVSQDLDTVDLTGNKEIKITYTVKNRNDKEDSKEITIIVDNTLPQAPEDIDMVSYDVTIPTKGGVNVVISANEPIQLIGEGWSYVDTTGIDKTKITKLYTQNTGAEGEAIVVKDLAGNEVQQKVIIMNIDTKVCIKPVQYSTTEPTNSFVRVTIIADEKLVLSKQAEDEGWTLDLSTDSKSIYKDFNDNTQGVRTIEVLDELGNTETVEYEISNIDKEGPKVYNVAYGETNPTQNSYVVTLYTDEEVASAIDNTSVKEDNTTPITVTPTWNIKPEDSKIVNVTVTENGTYKVILKDSLNNEREYSFEVTNIDTTPATVENIEKLPDTPVSSVRKETVTVVVTADEKVQLTDELSQKGWTLIENGMGVQKVFTQNGSDTIKLVDLAGNETNVDPITVTNIYAQPVIGGDFQENVNKYKNVTPTFDTMRGTATLQKDNEAPKPYTSGTIIGSADKSEDGSYTLKVTDYANNEVTRTFIIDNAEPVLYINGTEIGSDMVTNGKILKNGDTVNFTAIDSIDGNIAPTYTIDSYTEVGQSQPVAETPKAIVTDGTKDGVYTVTVNVEDEAGNENSKTFDITVDGTAPKYVKTSSSSPVGEAKEVTVIVYFDEELDQTREIDNGWKPLNEGMPGYEKAYTRTYTRNESVSLTVYDKAGNSTKKIITVDNVDTQEISVVDVIYTYEDEEGNSVTLQDGKTTNKNVTATIKTNKRIETVTTTAGVNGWTISEDGKTITKTFTAQGSAEETVTLKDASGWSVEVPVHEVYMDTTEPVLSTIQYSTTEFTNQPIRVTITSTTEALALPSDDEGWQYVKDSENKLIYKDYTENVTNKTINVKDLAGNLATSNNVVTIENYDATKPEVQVKIGTNGQLTTLENNGTYLFGDKVAFTITDTNLDTANIKYTGTGIVTEGIQYISGAEIENEGSYILTVPDKAGNVTTISFEINKSVPVIKLDDVSVANNSDETANIYNGTVTIKFENAIYTTMTILTQKPDGSYEEGTTTQIATGTQITQVGIYKIFARNVAGNTTTVQLEVTKGAEFVNLKDKYVSTDDVQTTGLIPEIKSAKGIKNVILEKYNEQAINADEQWTVVTYMNNSDITGLTPVNKVYNLTKIDGSILPSEFEGTYRLTIVDNFDVSNSKTFVIDVTGPSVTDSITKNEITEDGEYKTIKPTFDGVATLTRHDADGDKVVSNFVSGTVIDGTDTVQGEAPNYTKLSGDGSYTLEVIDVDGNTTTINFIIDNVKPTIQVLNNNTDNYEENKLYTSADGVITLKCDDTDIAKVVLKRYASKQDADKGKDSIDTYDVANMSELQQAISNAISVDGYYVFTVTDKAGNTQQATFTVDVNVDLKPVVYSNGTGVEPAQWVKVTIESNEELGDIPEGWNKEDAYTITRVYGSNTDDVNGLDDNEKGIITVKDKNGNSKVVKIVITGIDTTNPTVNDSTGLTFTPTGVVGVGGSIKVTITANEAIQEQPDLGWMHDEDGDVTKLVKTFTQNNGQGELVPVVDLAGNEIETPQVAGNIEIQDGKIKVVVNGIYESKPTYDVSASGLSALVGTNKVTQDTTITRNGITTSATAIMVPVANKIKATDCNGQPIENLNISRTINQYDITDEEMNNSIATISDNATVIDRTQACIYKIVYNITDPAGNTNSLTIIVNITGENI